MNILFNRVLQNVKIETQKLKTCNQFCNILQSIIIITWECLIFIINYLALNEKSSCAIKDIIPIKCVHYLINVCEMWKKKKEKTQKLKTYKLVCNIL